MRKSRRLGKSSELIIPMLIVLTVVVLVRVFLFDVNLVQGSSMCTTLYNGDVLVARKYGDIKRGDIVTIRSDVKDEELIVKRVVGMPGELIQIDDEGIVYADGVAIAEEYQMPTVGLELPYTSLQLGENEYFVLGDNRYNSYDSRYFGAVSAADIRDVAIFRFFPFTVY